jgi:hypothetical protein
MRKGTIIFIAAFLTAFICGCDSSASNSISLAQEASQSALVTTQAGKLVPTGSPSQLSLISFGATGMTDFYCFNGCIYKIVGDTQGMILVYKPSEVSAEPIGNVTNPLSPNAKDTETVHGVNNAQSSKDTSAPQSIAIRMDGQYYCRADYFINGTITNNNKAYSIAPVFIVGLITSEKLRAYQVDKKIGTSVEGYAVYSLKNPQMPDELAIDIPGMTCDIDSGKLYPLAILK